MSAHGHRPTTSGDNNPNNERALKKWQDNVVDEHTNGNDNASILSSQRNAQLQTWGVADFFGPEIFQIVLHNPTTSHQLLSFSQSRMCGENMEFLEKVDRCNTLLDELTKTLSEIYRNFTSPDAPRPLNLPQPMMRRMNMDIKETTLTTLPAMELIFSDAQLCIENILATDVYPRFVKHQMTVSAEKALSVGRSKYGGLGDCFCLTDPSKADNPITFASDGFLKVTGYSRTDVIPRNCRFLQGKYTDQAASRRLKEAILANQESVELLLNYRKNGEPFWNLLYVAPLFNAKGEVAFFIGGQINCSTTIHGRSDILRVLSMSDKGEEDDRLDLSAPQPVESTKFSNRLLRAFRSRNNNPSNNKTKAPENREAGMEGELINQIAKMDFKNQVKMFYTAYSKYLVLTYPALTISFFSPGVIEMLLIDPTLDLNFVGNNIFRVLTSYALNMSSEYKSSVKQSLEAGQAVSANISLATRRSLIGRGSEKFATHWTPLKDGGGKVGWVVVTFAALS